MRRECWPQWRILDCIVTLIILLFKQAALPYLFVWHWATPIFQLSPIKCADSKSLKSFVLMSWNLLLKLLSHKNRRETENWTKKSFNQNLFIVSRSSHRKCKQCVKWESIGWKKRMCCISMSLTLYLIQKSVCSWFLSLFALGQHS